MYDIVVKKFTFAITAPDEFLVRNGPRSYQIRWSNAK